MKLVSTLLFLLLGIILSSCSPEKFNQTAANVGDVADTTAQRRNHFMEQGKKPTVQIKEGFYVDTTPVDILKSPGWLTNTIVIRGEQLPFSYYSRTVTQGTSGAIVTTFQSDLDPSVVFSMNYTGDIRGALDVIAAKTGYRYHIDGRKVHWEAFISKTFDVGFMPGSSDYLMGSNSAPTEGGSGGGGSSAGGATAKDYVSADPSSAEYSSLKGKLSVWKDLETTITKMLSDKGRVVVSESSTSVTVTDRPYQVDMITKYIDNLNKSLAKQVLVKVQILEVQLEDDYIYGINWNNVINAFHNSGFQLNANYGTPISITPFSSAAVPTAGLNQLSNIPGPQNGSPGIPSYQALINALNQQGKTAIVSEPRVLCLNNQVSAIRIVNEVNYIASIQNTSQGTGGGANLTGQTTTQITPGKLTTGLTLYILPKILNNDIFLQVNADISNNLGITTVAAQGVSLGLPQVSMKHFNQRSMIRSGDTLILSGFKQISNQANQMQFFRSKTLGGQASQQLNKETIILITPIILNGSA